MKKILDLLEQKVQWIALALGVAFVLYMAWTYLIGSPVKVDVAGEELTPGEIDRKVLTVAEQLDARMTAKPVLSDLEKTPQYVAEFKSILDYGGKKPEPNLNALAYVTYGAARLPDSMRQSLPDVSLPPAVPQPGQAPVPVAPLAGQGTVEKLPTPSAPTIFGTPVTGLSNVNPRPPAANAAAAPVTVAGVDKAWVTIRFELELDSLAKQWAESKFPTNAQTTSFLQVVLTRQEMLTDGSWGNETAIKPLGIHNVPAYPAAGPAAAQYEYIKWAATHQPEILQPAFYPVLKGDAWFIPGEQAPPVHIVAAFNPEAFLGANPAELNKLTQEQRLAVSALKEKKRQEENRGRGSAPRTPRAVPGNLDNAPIDTGRPISYQAAQPVDDTIPIDVQPDMPAAPVRTSIVAGAGAGKLLHPPGEFDPRTWAAQHPRQPIVGWVHDDTAVPGATYRYKVRYNLKNPVFGQKLVVKEISLMEKLALESPDSAWSNPVDVASTVSFFVQSTPREAAGTLPIQIFRFKGGDPHTKIFNVAAGDGVGMADGDVDYSTGWTLVDYSKDPRPNSDDWQIILMDSKGSIRRRSLRQDMKDTRFQRMRDQAGAAAPAASAAP